MFIIFLILPKSWEESGWATGSERAENLPKVVG